MRPSPSRSRSVVFVSGASKQMPAGVREAIVEVISAARGAVRGCS